MRKLAYILTALLVLVTMQGCVLMNMANLAMYVVKGPPKFPAEYEGLIGKRTAVVCVSAADAYGPDSISMRVAREVRSLLAANVEEIEVVDEAEVSDWIDRHDFSSVDYVELGKAVNADRVVAVEINQPLSFREGPTLYRGMADFTVTVYDIKQNGKKEFRRRQEEFRWPGEARYGVSEKKFEQAFIRRVADRVGRYFYPWEEYSEIAENTSDVSGF